MATYTTNLGLKKPEGTDYVLIGDINGNMDTVDSTIGKPTQLETAQKTSLVAAINEVRSGALKAPYIGENGHWFVWDSAIGQFTDTGIAAPGPEGPEGAQGPRGYTYIPAISSDGVVSWTNDGDLENPAPVDVSGPQGPQGPAGQITDVTATIDNTSGNPQVDVKLGGTPEQRTISLAFTGLRGVDGQGAVGSVNGVLPDNTGNVEIEAGDILPVGIEGQVLTQTADGPAWANPTGGGSEASVTAYTVTLSASGWTADGDRYTQSVSVPTASVLSTNAISCIPHDGAKDWGYDIIPETQAAGAVTFTAGYLPADDLLYDIIVTDASTVYVDAVAVHNVDPYAHPNLEIILEEVE